MDTLFFYFFSTLCFFSFIFFFFIFLTKHTGGRVTGSVSGKTNFLVVGKQPGASKVSKARASGKVKLVNLHDLSEGQFFCIFFYLKSLMFFNY